MFMKKRMGKLVLIMLSVSFLLLQGCGEKDSVSGYDGSSGASVEQMIQDKLNGLAGQDAPLEEDAFLEEGDHEKTAVLPL